MTTIENNDYEDAVTGSLKLNQNSQRFTQKDGEKLNTNIRKAMPPPRYKIMRAGSSNPRKEKLNQSYTAEQIPMTGLSSMNQRQQIVEIKERVFG